MWNSKSYLVSAKIVFFVPGFIQEWRMWGESNISSFIFGISLGNEEVV